MPNATETEEQYKEVLDLCDTMLGETFFRHVERYVFSLESAFHRLLERFERSKEKATLLQLHYF
jgi:hypothetical protein